MESLILLDTGDALVGDGLLGNQTMGEAIVAGMNLMGYDAMALGPKELSLGEEVLRQRIEEMEFPVLSANLVLSYTGDLAVRPYTILDLDLLRVGVIGLTRPPSEDPAKWGVLDPQEVLMELVPEVRRQAETVILLTNIPDRSARELAQAVPGIDLVVAALPDQLPDRAVRVPETGTLVVTADQSLPRHAGRRVGWLSVTVGDDGSIGSESWTSVPMGPEYRDDSNMKALLDGYR